MANRTQTGSWRRRHFIFASLGLAGTALANGIFAAATPGLRRPLEFGLAPYLPTGRLLTVFEPLRAHFATVFQRSVAMSTAPDFKSFQHRALDGAFDIYLIGPGPGWQSYRDRQHLIVAAVKARLQIYLLVARGGPVRKIANLRGRTLATIDPLTVTAQVATSVLRDNGLQPGQDVMLRTERTPFDAAQAVALGEAAAAACPDVAWPSLPAELQEKLHILYRSEPMPNGLLMLRPGADVPSLETIRQALFAFTASPAGETFAQASALVGFVLPDLEALAQLERFLPEIRRVMSQP